MNNSIFLSVTGCKHSPFPGIMQACKRQQAHDPKLSAPIPGTGRIEMWNGQLIAIMALENGESVACVLSQAIEWRFDFEAGWRLMSRSQRRVTGAGAQNSRGNRAGAHKGNGVGTEPVPVRAATELLLNFLVAAERADIERRIVATRSEPEFPFAAE
jgi:hypothetical protein